MKTQTIVCLGLVLLAVAVMCEDEKVPQEVGGAEDDGAVEVEEETSTKKPEDEKVEEEAKDDKKAQESKEEKEGKYSKDEKLDYGTGKHRPHKKEDDIYELSESDKKYRMHLVTTQIDRNGDKSISLEEMTNWVWDSLRSRGTLREENVVQLKKIFAQGDNNPKDNLLSWREVLKGKHKYTVEEVNLFKMDVEKNYTQAPFVIEAVELITEEEERFKIADDDEDDHLDLQELAAFLHPYDYERMHEIELRRVMREKDLNKDGKVDLREFIGEEKRDDEKHVEQQTEAFKEIDLDGNGKLSRLEVKKWVIPDLREVAKTEALHIIDECDKNKDNILEYDELLRHENFWLSMTAKGGGTHYKDEL